MDGIIFLTVDEVVFIHQDQIKRYGGTPGILNPGSLESAVAAPEFSAYYNPGSDIHWLAAHYAVHLTQNHAFHDGNNRTGIASALVFLAMNGTPKQPTPKAMRELEALMVDIAQHLRGKEDLSELLRSIRP
ncbi:MAG: type II toxin-antitoxin system death-on-curing family toxin [Holophagaceae bacterium]|nr:type II toxin-antitoxin system death-on-curing family toxin [Holophagaceae bacterium]